MGEEQDVGEEKSAGKEWDTDEGKEWGTDEERGVGEEWGKGEDDSTICQTTLSHLNLHS